MDISQSESEKISFFLFINSKSGGGLGRKYLTIPKGKLIYQFGKNTTVCLHFVDLFNAEQRRKGLERMGKALAKTEKKGRGKVNAVVCGGDGTVLWVVSVIGQQGIDLNKICFCIIPIGTGNDFSRCLGWGGSPISFSSGHLDQLKQRLLEWLQAEQSWFDVWHASVSTYEDGEIIQIRDKQEVSTNLKELQRGFCNYFGIGVDARICYYVELKRQKNKWLNLALYGCIGLCKLFQRIRTTRQAIQTFTSEEVTDRNEERGEEKRLDAMKEEPLLHDAKGKIELKPGYGNLLALNSIRYMAGLKNVWNTSKLGIKTNSSPEFSEQRFDDGKIEFIGFKNELRLGLERIGNFGARVAQGEGPFQLEFHRTENNSSTYIHIDGEAMRLHQLKSVTISKSKLAPNGRIRVLLKKRI